MTFSPKKKYTLKNSKKVLNKKKKREGKKKIKSINLRPKNIKELKKKSLKKFPKSSKKYSKHKGGMLASDDAAPPIAAATTEDQLLDYDTFMDSELEDKTYFKDNGKLLRQLCVLEIDNYENFKNIINKLEQYLESNKDEANFIEFKTIFLNLPSNKIITFLKQFINIRCVEGNDPSKFTQYKDSEEKLYNQFNVGYFFNFISWFDKVENLRLQEIFEEDLETKTIDLSNHYIELRDDDSDLLKHNLTFDLINDKERIKIIISNDPDRIYIIQDPKTYNLTEIKYQDIIKWSLCYHPKILKQFKLVDDDDSDDSSDEE